MKNPTIYDVAEAAGVSISSVSRVLNGSDAVSDGMMRRVRLAIRDLKYRPNQAAQALGRSHARSSPSAPEETAE
jgi:DNA-binding LacI/PurR family transcriptional regulator